MSNRPDERACTRRGLYYPYPARKTARRVLRAAALAAAALLAAGAAHTRLAVAGTSMAPTLRPGDRLLVRRWPRRVVTGAMIVVADPREPRRLVVKRVGEVRAGAVTLLGDNPAASTDSRSWGAVPVAAVRGRVVYRYAPTGSVGRLR